MHQWLQSGKARASQKGPLLRLAQQLRKPVIVGEGHDVDPRFLKQQPINRSEFQDFQHFWRVLA